MKNVFVLFLLMLSVATGSKILGIVPFPSYSHQIVFQPLWKELSLRGHQVTTLTTNPINDPNLVNLTEIDLSSTYDLWTTSVRKAVVLSQENMFKSFFVMVTSTIAFVDKQLEIQQVQNLLHDKNATFDLVIVEYIVPVMFAFAERFNCPHIGITSVDPPNFVYDFVKSPLHPVFHTDSLRPYDDKDTLLGRVKSFLNIVAVKMIHKFYVIPASEAVVKKHFGDDYPSLWSIARNASALMVNTNTVFQKILSLPPNVVQIGGKLHQNDTTPLTKEIEKILDESEGFIYLSMGTNVKTTDLPLKSQIAILEALSELPYMVLWKFDLDYFRNTPKNVIISKWFPQQSVLRHPKIKLFITQGGRQSMDESIASQVPMIGIPFYADQFYNVQKMAAQGYGLSIDYVNLHKTEFKSAILEVIENSKYRNTLKELSELADDQPMTGLERAVWWTEYVLRHKGARHLRNPFIDVPLYQYLLLDVLAVCLFVSVIILYLLYSLVKFFNSCLKSFKFKVKKE